MAKIRLPAHVAEAVTHFSGRSWMLPEILDWYQQSDKRLLLITGMPGTGKSMVAAWLAGFGNLPPQGKDQADLKHIRELITAAFFCRADSYENSPMEMGNQLARQTAEKLPREFAEALVNLGGKRINITFGKVEAGAKATAVVVKRLDLSGLLDEPAFDLALLKPLRELEDSGLSVPALFLVDALDEGALYTGRFKVAQAVKKLVELNPHTRVIATLRSKADELSYFPNAAVIDLIEDAPRDASGVVEDVRAFVEGRLAQRGNGSLAALKEHLLEKAGGYFLFASMVLDDLLMRLDRGEELVLDDVPDALGDQYHRFLLRLRDEQDRSWEKELRPILGGTAVAQGPGLSRSAIARFTQRGPGPDLVGTLDTLKACKQYLVGSFNEGPFRLFHQSFSEYLLEDQQDSSFTIEAFAPHGDIVRHYWPATEKAPKEENWDDYGRLYMPLHLARASEIPDDDERHRLASLLAQLVVEPVLGGQRAPTNQEETARLENDLLQALQTACTDPQDAGLPLIWSAVSAWRRFRSERLRPDLMLSEAAAGRVDDALRQLPLYGLDRRWEKAIRLVIAWLALAKNKRAARSAFNGVSTNHPFPHPLGVLHGRVLDSLDGIGEPQLINLPPATHLDDIEARIRRLSAYSPQGGFEGYFGEPGYEEHLFEEIDIRIGNIPAYITQNDAPYLVAYATADEKGGTEAFRTYMRLHAVNQYREYRNIQFWLLLEAVLRHPNPDWVLPMLREVAGAYLGGQGTAFEEGFPQVVLALQAHRGSATARQALEARRTEALERIKKLSKERGRGDIWGEHKRRLCALALAYKSLVDTPGEDPKALEKIVDELLDKAVEIPRGYAGLMTPAWLHLAEIAQLCGSAEDKRVAGALQQAIETVHKINDPLFCARATARVNAMQQRWWPFPAGEDLASVVMDFARDPRQGKYAPVHLVQTEYEHRDSEDNSSFPMGVFVTEWRLEGLAEIYRITYEELAALNPELSRTPEQKLDQGTEVNLSDPEFAPLLAARLAAEVAVSGLDQRRKRLLIQALVPVALPDRTALDAVLARLLFVARPPAAQLDQLGQSLEG